MVPTDKKEPEIVSIIKLKFNTIFSVTTRLDVLILMLVPSIKLFYVSRRCCFSCSHMFLGSHCPCRGDQGMIEKKKKNETVWAKGKEPEIIIINTKSASCFFSLVRSSHAAPLGNKNERTKTRNVFTTDFLSRLFFVGHTDGKATLFQKILVI